MNIVQITPGAGGMFCGGCFRDNALVGALRHQGHDTLMIPLYLPLTLDEENQSAGTPIFFSGINVYFEQKSSFFRTAPRWLHRIFASPWLLYLAGRHAGHTRPRETGDIMLSMLRGEDGHQARELNELAAWLKNQSPRPDIVSLSNVFLAGLAPMLRSELGIPIVGMLQGEDTFLDSMEEPIRSACWNLLTERVRHLDAFLAPSHYFADLMAHRLHVDRARIHVVYNGISLEGYPAPAADSPAPAPTTPPTIGFFARMCREKGLDGIVQTFLELNRRGRVPGLRLKIGGGCGPSDLPQVDAAKRLLAQNGCLDRVSFHPNIGRGEKIDFLRSLTVFCTPALYGEAFGLYVIEALAAGIPVVQPRHAAFPEIMDATGGGLLTGTEPAALADGVEHLLLNPTRAQALGRSGQKVVHEFFNVDRMARETAAVLEKVRSLSRPVSRGQHGPRPLASLHGV